MKDIRILKGDSSSNIELIQFLDETMVMCDVSVKDVHCYFANNVLTHNCSEELNITGNLSGERVFTDSVNEGVDLHMRTAREVFGIEDETMRDRVKSISFGVLYGMDKYSLSKRLKTTVDQAGEMMNTYFTKLSKLTRWRKFVMDTARRKGMIFTFFGRPRLLYKYYASSDFKDHAFADRSSVNSCIQGCLPTDCMIELKNQAVKLSGIFLNKVITADGRSAIPSSRGKGMATFTMMQSGDFIVADREHGLIYGNIDKPNYRRICDGLDVDVLTSPLGKKSLSLKSLFYYLFSKQTLKFKFLQKIKSLAAAEKVLYSKDVSTLLFLLNLTRFHFHFDSYIYAANFRTIASLHGYNVVAVNKTTDNTEYKVTRSRKKKVHPIWTKEIGQMSIGSLTLQSGYQYYQSQGFQNKNTGGDVIRIVLTKFFRLIAHDKEFRENFIVAFPIHDECDCYVKKSYLFKGFYKLKEIMTLRPANWKSPLKVEIGVGRSWGDCLDVVGVTRDNRLIVEGINDEEELPKLNLDVRGLPHDTPEERDKENLRILSEHNGTDEYELRKIGLLK